MRLFSPRKTTLLFVIRDKTKVYTLLPLMRMCPVLYYYIHWFTMFLAFCTDSVGKFGAYSERRYSKGDFSLIFLLLSFIWFLVLFTIVCKHEMNSSDLGWSSKTSSSFTHSS